MKMPIIAENTATPINRIAAHSNPSISLFGLKSPNPIVDNEVKE
jgi:hypothetical protein